MVNFFEKLGSKKIKKILEYIANINSDSFSLEDGKNSDKRKIKRTKAIQSKI